MLIRHNCFNDNGFVEIRQRYVSQQSISESVIALLRYAIDDGERSIKFGPNICKPAFTVSENNESINYYFCCKRLMSTGKHLPNNRIKLILLHSRTNSIQSFTFIEHPPFTLAPSLIKYSAI